MKFPLKCFLLAGAVILAVGSVPLPASALVLSTGAGDGSVILGVDAFGSFGSAVSGTSTSDATYDPIGAIGPAGTTFESGIAIGFGGARTFMTSGDIQGSSGGTVTTPISGLPVLPPFTSATSAFTFNNLSIALTQVVAPVLSGAVQIGSQLTQTYAITNLTEQPRGIEVVRYMDGDLDFDGSLIDGGGRLFAGATEILFETDTAAGTSTATTFLGITGEGGTVPATGRFEIDSFPALASRIINGTALDDLITNDGADQDQFIDVGLGYDVTLALLNTFTLGGGQSGTYVTRTIFGTAAPSELPPPDLEPTPEVPIPEPGTIALLGSGLAAMAAVAWRRRRRS